MAAVDFYNSPNRAGVRTLGPPRYTKGKKKGQVIPTTRESFRSVLCAKCELPSQPRLSPFVRIVTREGQKPFYVHMLGCPEGETLLKLKRVFAGVLKWFQLGHKQVLSGADMKAIQQQNRNWLHARRKR